MRFYVGERREDGTGVFVVQREEPPSAGELVEAELVEKLSGPRVESALSTGTEPGSATADAAPPPFPATGSALVEACERAWSDIRVHHPDLPEVVVVLGSGIERGRLVKLGHWWGGRWLADGEVRGEVLLAGEALHLTPAQVFEVLLHEAP